MAFIVLGVALVLLKVFAFGPVATWSWWAVLSPFAGAAVWWWWSDASGWTKRREMDKMDERRKKRRVEALDRLGLDAQGRRPGSDDAGSSRRR